jgi:ATPase subunit of ABC transporter with duplicated ATPase domains
MRILRGLTSRVLSCGCIAGVYETYDGALLVVSHDRDFLQAIGVEREVALG